MLRTVAALTEADFDVLIIGGGAFGAAAAHDAAMRGLRTAVIDAADFGAGASAECFKMVHGGIRYLQHADLRRARASCHERSAFLRIAPHLVSPLPIAIPTYGRGRSGKAFLGAGATAYDLLTLDRNLHTADEQRHIRRTRFLSRSELLRMFPHLNAPDLSGAVVFEDGQMYNPSRLVLAFIKSATATGAVACNYVQAKEFVWNGSSVRGVKAIDQLTGNEIEIRARLTLNAAGPWAEYLNRDPVRFGTWKRSPFSRDAYFIVDRQPTSPYALAVQGLSRDKDAVLARSNRHLFAVPWRKRTLLGVWHRFFTEQPDTAAVSPAEIDTWMAELNTVYPQLELQASEVTFANCGLVPFGDTATQTELSFGKESRYIDHRTAHGVAGLVTLVGIRFTTARADAARALDMLLQQRAVRPARAPTDRVALAGGNIESFEQLQRDAHRAYAPLMSTESLDALLRNYGTEHRQIVQRMQHRTELGRVVPGTHVLRAEIAHAVENEMAVHLDDVVLRRTDISADRHPGRAALDITAAAMGELLGWSPRRVREEIERTDMTLAKHLARDAEQLGTEHSPQTTSNGAMFAKITV